MSVFPGFKAHLRNASFFFFTSFSPMMWDGPTVLLPATVTLFCGAGNKIIVINNNNKKQLKQFGQMKVCPAPHFASCFFYILAFASLLSNNTNEDKDSSH